MSQHEYCQCCERSNITLKEVAYVDSDHQRELHSVLMCKDCLVQEEEQGNTYVDMVNEDQSVVNSHVVSNTICNHCGIAPICFASAFFCTICKDNIEHWLLQTRCACCLETPVDQDGDYCDDCVEAICAALAEQQLADGGLY
jgi:hypothetical protein